MKSGFQIAVLLAFLFSFAHTLFALYPPEPQSGGTYIYAKGTKSAEDYRAQGRTGRPTTDYYYGKGIKTGALTLRPMVGYAGEFDSNVYFEDNDADEDYINRLVWGVDADVPFNYKGEHKIFAGVQNQYEWFVKEGSQDHADWLFQGGGQFNFAPFSLEIYEESKDTSERSGSELLQRVERDENFISGILTIPLSEMFIETEVNDYNIAFEDSAFDNRDRNEFAVFPRLGVNVGTRTQVLAEYGYRNLNYDENVFSGDANQVALGLRGFAGQGDLVSYQIWGGYEFIDYDNSSREGYNGFIVRGQAIYRLNERTKIIADGNRRAVESISSTGLYFVRNEVSLKLRQQIAERLFGSVRALGGWNQYVTSRDDWYWDPGLGLEYVLPGNIVSIFAEYRFTGRESDAANSDYMRHLATLGVKAEV